MDWKQIDKDAGEYLTARRKRIREHEMSDKGWEALCKHQVKVLGLDLAKEWYKDAVAMSGRLSNDPIEDEEPEATVGESGEVIEGTGASPEVQRQRDTYERWQKAQEKQRKASR